MHTLYERCGVLVRAPRPVGLCGAGSLRQSTNAGLGGCGRAAHEDTPPSLRPPTAAVATPPMREDLRQRGFVAMGGTPQELAKWTSEQAPVWGPVLQAAGIKPE